MSDTFNENDFESLKKGDTKALDKLYVNNYQYVLGMLVYRNGAIREDAEDIYMDALLKFHDAVIEEKVVWGNISGYLLKTALNLLRDKQRKESSIAKKMEMALGSLYEEKEPLTFDKVEESDSIFYDGGINQRRTAALKIAWEKLGDVCRDLLQDTIVYGIKPRFLMEKYEFKNTRVITDKKIKCKKKLLKLVEKQLT